MDDQLKHLYDYTKFHIGMYTTLSALIVGVLGNAQFSESYSALLPYFKASLIFFIVAGAAGGLVASSIPFYPDFSTFSNARLGIWRAKRIPAIACTHLEHSAFWIGCMIAAWGFLRIG